MKKFVVNSINDYDKILNYIFEKNTRIFLFKGELGSGKTTLIQSICKKFGVKDKVLSPTFNLVNEYSSYKNDMKLFHFDLYRIKNINELIQIDFIDIIDSGSYCFIEWPDICKNLINTNFLELNFKIISESKREIIII